MLRFCNYVLWSIREPLSTEVHGYSIAIEMLNIKAWYFFPKIRRSRESIEAILGSVWLTSLFPSLIHLGLSIDSAKINCCSKLQWYYRQLCLVEYVRIFIIFLKFNPSITFCCFFFKKRSSLSEKVQSNTEWNWSGKKIVKENTIGKGVTVNATEKIAARYDFYTENCEIYSRKGSSELQETDDLVFFLI